MLSKQSFFSFGWAFANILLTIIKRKKKSRSDPNQSFWPPVAPLSAEGFLSAFTPAEPPSTRNFQQQARDASMPSSRCDAACMVLQTLPSHSAHLFGFQLQQLQLFQLSTQAHLFPHLQQTPPCQTSEPHPYSAFSPFARQNLPDTLSTAGYQYSGEPFHFQYDTNAPPAVSQHQPYAVHRWASSQSDPFNAAYMTCCKPVLRAAKRPGGAVAPLGLGFLFAFINLPSCGALFSASSSQILRWLAATLTPPKHIRI